MNDLKGRKGNKQPFLLLGAIAMTDLKVRKAL